MRNQQFVIFLWNLVLARGSLEPPTCRVELRLRRARYPLLHGGEWTQSPLKSMVVCILVDVESAACAFLRSLKNLLLRRGFCQKFTRPELTAGMATTCYDTDATCRRVKREHQSWFNCRPILQWDHKNWSIDSLWWSSPRKSLVNFFFNFGKQSLKVP